uniref:Uncharacterized protein n=1 Tax=Roseihalotalea indica TaxID=2867963 RepID=A0AA49JEM9_9BACT|nr:hypothetical protein K4G66_02080 [Tunicatimonas sp. TK19036]
MLILLLRRIEGKTENGNRSQELMVGAGRLVHGAKKENGGSRQETVSSY